MMLKKFLSLALFILLTLRQLTWVAPASASSLMTSGTPPNVLIIMVDDLASVFAAYGGQAITPNIDRLFAEGMAFTNAHVTVPVCNPSRISMLTGLRPSSTGITSLSPEHTDWRTTMADPNSMAYQNYGPGIDQVTTIFQHFQQNGYWVGSAGKTFHSYEQLIGESWDQLAIWEFWPGIGWPADRPLHGMTEYYSQVSLDSDWGVIDNEVNAQTGLPYVEADLPDFKIANDTIGMIESAPADKPFLIGAGFMLPHLPWYVPQRALDLYPLDQIRLPETRADDLADIPPEGVALVWQGGGFYDQKYVFDDEQQWRKAIAHYLAGVSYMDEQVGKVLAALAASGRGDNTIVVFWSDNGFHLGEKKHLQKLTLWEVSTATPLAIKAPGVTTPASSTAAAVSAVDLFPTLAGLAGLAMPTDFPRDGRSLMPLLQDPQAYWPWPAMTTLGRWAVAVVDRASLRMGDWRYINYDLPFVSPQAQQELYARDADPHEWRNLLSPTNGVPADVQGVRNLMEFALRGQLRPDKPPTTASKLVTAEAGATTPISLGGTDPNADFLIFTIASLPAHGQLYQRSAAGDQGERITQAGQVVDTTPGWTASVVYKPNPGARADVFRFAVSDGRNTDTATVFLAVQEEPRAKLMTPFWIPAGSWSP